MHQASLAAYRYPDGAVWTADRAADTDASSPNLTTTKPVTA